MIYYRRPRSSCTITNACQVPDELLSDVSLWATLKTVLHGAVLPGHGMSTSQILQLAAI